MPFLSRLFGREKSKDIAKERLRLVLVHDRSTVSPELLDRIKEDIIKVISGHLEVDAENTEVEFTREKDSVALIASFPVKNLKRTPR